MQSMTRGQSGNNGIDATQICATGPSQLFALFSPPTCLRPLPPPPSPPPPPLLTPIRSLLRTPEIPSYTCIALCVSLDGISLAMSRNNSSFASPVLSSANKSYGSGTHGTAIPPVRFGETGWGSRTMAVAPSLAAQAPRNLAKTSTPTPTHYTNAQLLGHAPAWSGAYQAPAPQVRNIQRTESQRTYHHELASTTLADWGDASSSANEGQCGRSTISATRISTTSTNLSRSRIWGAYPVSTVSRPFDGTHHPVYL